MSTIAGIPGHAGFQDGQGNKALFCGTWGLAAAHDGSRLYCCEYEGNRVRQIDLRDGKHTVGTVLGNGLQANRDGPAGTCSVNRPVLVVAVGADLIVSCYSGRVCKYAAKTGKFRFRFCVVALSVLSLACLRV